MLVNSNIYLVDIYLPNLPNSTLQLDLYDMSQTESGVRRRKSYDDLCDLQFVPYEASRLLRVNINLSIISLHDTPRLHTLKRVIRICFIWRTYNESSKLTLGFIHQNPIKSLKFLLLYSHKNNKIKK